MNAPHLLLEKSTGMTEFSVGVPSTYVLKVTNVGTAATSGKITIVDTLPVSMTLGELYLHQGQWKFNPVGNGVHMDLAGQCALYGVTLA